MGVQAQHLVMYGIKLTQEEAHARFPSAPAPVSVRALRQEHGQWVRLRPLP